jgi:hypothetical protein
MTVTTLNYCVIADLRTLQITTVHAKSSQSAFTSYFLVTDLNNGDPSAPVFTLLLSGKYPTTALTKSSLHRLPYSCSNCAPYNILV